MVSGVGGESPQHCQCAHNTTVAHLSVRDKRLVPQVLHGSVGIVLLGMCFVLGLFFWKMLHSPLYIIKVTIHGIYLSDALCDNSP